MVRTSEGGSILSFVVVGAILTVLLVGGVYAVRQHFVSAQQTPASEKTDQKPTSESQPATDGAQKPANEPAPTQSPVTPPVAETMPAVDVTPDSGAATELPQTGPVSALMSGLALALLTSSLVAYLRSRRYQLPSAFI